MKRSIKLTFFLLISVILININNITYASSFNFEATADETELYAEDIINIDIKISNIDAGELGINTLEAYLEYDTEIFETVTQENFSTQNDWMIAYNGGEGERKGKFLAILLEAGETEDTTIANIKLKVKSDVTEYTETNIKFTNIATNDGVELVKETDKQIDVIIGEKEPPVVITNEIVLDDDIAPGKIPQTGITRVITLTIGTGLIILAVFMYRKYRNIDR